MFGHITRSVSGGRKCIRQISEWLLLYLAPVTLFCVGAFEQPRALDQADISISNLDSWSRPVYIPLFDDRDFVEVHPLSVDVRLAHHPSTVENLGADSFDGVEIPSKLASAEHLYVIL